MILNTLKLAPCVNGGYSDYLLIVPTMNSYKAKIKATTKAIGFSIFELPLDVQSTNVAQTKGKFFPEQLSFLENMLHDNSQLHALKQLRQDHLLSPDRASALDMNGVSCLEVPWSLLFGICMAI